MSHASRTHGSLMLGLAFCAAMASCETSGDTHAKTADTSSDAPARNQVEQPAPAVDSPTDGPAQDSLTRYLAVLRLPAPVPESSVRALAEDLIVACGGNPGQIQQVFGQTLVGFSALLTAGAASRCAAQDVVKSLKPVPKAKAF